jgi:hypothetical protein
MSPWVRDVHSGGTPIPTTVQEETRSRILAAAEKLGLSSKFRLEIRCKGASVASRHFFPCSGGPARGITPMCARGSPPLKRLSASSAWGDSVICPRCGRGQPEGALNCANCGVVFKPGGPPRLTPQALLPWSGARTLFVVLWAWVTVGRHDRGARGLLHTLECGSPGDRPGFPAATVSPQGKR